MNKNILQLVKKAGGEVCELCLTSNPPQYVKQVFLDQRTIEKFADLLLKDIFNLDVHEIKTKYDIDMRPGAITRAIKRGDRVRIIGGFDVGAKGTVEFVQPAGDCIWILRDGTTDACWYRKEELDHA
jgi:hypothetical protein